MVTTTEFRKYPIYPESTIRTIQSYFLAGGFLFEYEQKFGKQLIILTDLQDRGWHLCRFVINSILDSAGITAHETPAGTLFKFTIRINPEENGWVWTKDENIKIPAPRPVIAMFKYKHAFLSNFYNCPVAIVEGPNMVTYPSSECAYQAQKCILPRERIQFRSCTSKQAKKLGKKVDMRADWDKIKVSIMEDVVRNKFEQNPKLAQKLLDTGDADLVEGNTWNDTFWGVCGGVGENHLGKILMLIRAELSYTKINSGLV